MPIQVVNTRNVLKTSFAAGLRISSDMDLLFLSGVTARPLDLAPEDPFQFPEDPDQQARRVNLQGAAACPRAPDYAQRVAPRDLMI